MNNLGVAFDRNHQIRRVGLGNVGADDAVDNGFQRGRRGVVGVTGWHAGNDHHDAVSAGGIRHRFGNAVNGMRTTVFGSKFQTERRVVFNHFAHDCGKMTVFRRVVVEFRINDRRLFVFGFFYRKQRFVAGKLKIDFLQQLFFQRRRTNRQNGDDFAFADVLIRGDRVQYNLGRHTVEFQQPVFLADEDAVAIGGDFAQIALRRDVNDVFTGDSRRQVGKRVFRRKISHAHFSGGDFPDAGHFEV